MPNRRRGIVRIPLAKYGIREVILFGGIALAGAVLSAVFLWYLVPLFVVALAFVLYFFRDPSRRPPDEPRVLVSPADGRVVEVAEVEEPEFLKSLTHKIAIFMSPLNVHVNRVPCDGRVEGLTHRAGRHLNARAPDASSRNEASAMTLADVEGDTRVLVRQVAGAVARRIVCTAQTGQRLQRGDRYGMIKFGSRAEVYVPVESGFDVEVRLGQGVKAGETILGRFR
jgi:phosphatidylserine decarboxylase